MPAQKQVRAVVVGSLNMDLVLGVESLPRPGETITAKDLKTVTGGKGANQAVALARLGAQVVMIGRVGNDSYGNQLRTALENEGIDVEHVLVTAGSSSGLATIAVSSSGENMILILPGANGHLTPSDIEAHESLFRETDLLLVQNEVPQATVEAAVLLAKKHGVTVVFDPAPAPDRPLPKSLWEVDVLTPNHTEAESLLGHTMHSTADALAAARTFRERGARRVVLKLGDQGAIAVDRNDHWFQVPATRVEVVDTTAAGDAFTAAMALSLAAGSSFETAVHWGCAAGTLAVTRSGAQPSLPTRAAVEEFLEKAHNSATDLHH